MRNSAPKANLSVASELLVALGLAFALVLNAQAAGAQTESGWSNQGLIYLLGPALDGTSGIGPVDTEVDLSAGDVLTTSIAPSLVCIAARARAGAYWSMSFIWT